MTGTAAVRSLIGVLAISALASGASPQALAEATPMTQPATEAPAKAKPRKPNRRKAAVPKSRASKLDLTVRDLPETRRSTPGAPPFVAPIDGTARAIVDRRGADSGITSAERVAETYRTEPLFQSEQKLQILDAEVPVSVKLGKWKTSEESKALGLSATVPLAGAK